MKARLTSRIPLWALEKFRQSPTKKANTTTWLCSGHHLPNPSHPRQKTIHFSHLYARVCHMFIPRSELPPLRHLHPITTIVDRHAGTRATGRPTFQPTTSFRLTLPATSSVLLPGHQTFMPDGASTKAGRGQRRGRAVLPRGAHGGRPCPTPPARPRGWRAAVATRFAAPGAGRCGFPNVLKSLLVRRKNWQGSPPLVPRTPSPIRTHSDLFS